MVVFHSNKNINFIAFNNYFGSFYNEWTSKYTSISTYPLQQTQHHKLPTSLNFNRICVKIIKQYVHVKFMGFKV
jgi:hypothetical protein